MRVYVQSLGVVGALRLQGGLLLLSLALAALDQLVYGYAVMLAGMVILLWVLTAIGKDQRTLSHHVSLASDSRRLESDEMLDASRAGPLQSLFPLLDNLVRLNRRELKSIQSISHEMQYSSTELAANARSVASYSQKQADIINASASAATEISASIDEVATRIEQTKRSADEGQQLCLVSEKAMRETELQVEKVAGNVKKADHSLEVLEEKMTSIIAMSDVIRDMAEQTNLLSLNAAIEAARAGEQGRGFNVVAEEVRRLAQTSHQSATAITKQVKEVTESMATVVEQVRHVAASSEASQVSVASAMSAIDQVVASLNDVTQQIAGIAIASEQQAIATKEISKNMEEVALAAGKNAAMAKENANVADHLKSLTA